MARPAPTAVLLVLTIRLLT